MLRRSLTCAVVARYAPLVAAAGAASAAVHRDIPGPPGPEPRLLQDASTPGVQEALLACESETHDLEQEVQRCQESTTAQEQDFQTKLGNATSILDHYMKYRGEATELQDEVAQKEAQVQQLQSECSIFEGQLFRAAANAKSKWSLLRTRIRGEGRAASREEPGYQQLLTCQRKLKSSELALKSCKANLQAEAARLGMRLETRNKLSSSAVSAADTMKEQLAILDARIVSLTGRRDRLRARLQDITDAMAT